MIALGIDPGLAETGYGLVSCREGKFKRITHGCIKTAKNLEHPDRLNAIHQEVLKVIKEHRPDVVVIESLFFNVNAKSALSVGQAIGVVKLAASQKKVKVIDYPPLKIKMSLTGNGRADKKMIQQEVKKVLKLKEIPRPSHAADALAVAICHWREMTGDNLRAKNAKKKKKK